jgi:hypothetical protein
MKAVSDWRRGRAGYTERQSLLKDLIDVVENTCLLDDRQLDVRAGWHELG